MAESGSVVAAPVVLLVVVVTAAGEGAAPEAEACTSNKDELSALADDADTGTEGSAGAGLVAGAGEPVCA